MKHGLGLNYTAADPSGYLSVKVVSMQGLYIPSFLYQHKQSLTQAAHLEFKPLMLIQFSWIVDVYN